MSVIFVSVRRGVWAALFTPPAEDMAVTGKGRASFDSDIFGPTVKEHRAECEQRGLRSCRELRKAKQVSLLKGVCVIGCCAEILTLFRSFEGDFP